MKRMSVTCLMLFVSGCASNTATLIDEAMRTGNWSLVNARLEGEERRAERSRPSCRRGSTALCVSDFGVTECRCVASAALAHDLGRIAR